MSLDKIFYQSVFLHEATFPLFMSIERLFLHKFMQLSLKTSVNLKYNLNYFVIIRYGRIRRVDIKHIDLIYTKTTSGICFRCYLPCFILSCFVHHKM